MTPAARLQAAIELLDEIIIAARDSGAAGDIIAQRFFSARRYAGSKDRRAIRALTWQALRAFGDRPPSGRAAMLSLADGDEDLSALFDGSPYGAAVPSDAELAVLPTTENLLPKVLTGKCYPQLNDAGEIAALLERAPLDVRINRERAEGLELPAGEPLPMPLDGISLPPDTDIQQHPTFLSGAIEVQDAGSQWLAQACLAQSGQRIVDLCAGAGGKTLALAAAIKNKGTVLACDVDRRRLSQLAPRAARAGATSISECLLNAGKELEALQDWRARADCVLVDAPCSGSGTWRRNPEARWRLTDARLGRLREMQSRLLQIGAELVAPGGALVYAVCALTRAEGEDMVQQFLANNRIWQPVDIHKAGIWPVQVGRSVGAGTILTPRHDQTDGFYCARLVRR